MLKVDLCPKVVALIKITTVNGEDKSDKKTWFLSTIWVCFRDMKLLETFLQHRLFGHLALLGCVCLDSTLLIRSQLPTTGVAVEGDDPQFNVSSSMTSSSIGSTPSTPLLMSSYSRGSLTFSPVFSTSSSSNIYGDQQSSAAQGSDDHLF